MTIEPREVRTSIAILKRMRPDHIEVHYLSGAMLNTAGLAEVRKARRELMGNAPYSMLSIIPEDVDYAASAMSVDHLADDRKEGALLAIAVVAHANMMEMILKLYFSYYPQLNRIKVTPSEADARAWLKAQMEEIGQTGS
ncbi:MAG: hypothetical protein K8H89_06045 [Flavobacteriales bacterium]|jgi:hypothetical protein|nr:hypothetical protein [Flavobacteriales bacterium]